MAQTYNVVDDETIDYLLEDANGAHVYSNTRALYGYLSADKNLFVPYDIRTPEPGAINLNELGDRTGITRYLGQNGETFRQNNPYPPAYTISKLMMRKVIFMNYIMLRSSGMSVEAAYLASCLRMRWILLGCLYADNDERRTPYDEVTRVQDNDPLLGNIVQARTGAELLAVQEVQDISNEIRSVSRSEFYGTAFATKWAETIWCISELVFRIRGHHYKDSYQGLIARTFRATTEGAVELPATFPYAEIFHTAIHPFGIRALPVKAAYFAAHAKIGNSLLIRFSGAPNGTALFTTSAAGLRILASEAWYSKLETSYKGVIEATMEISSNILNNKYAYHLSASLYGLPRLNNVQLGNKLITLGEAESIVSSLAPILQGYTNGIAGIQSQTRSLAFAFGEQKVLNKRAATNPLASIKMQTLIEVMVDKMQNTQSVGDIIDLLAPIEDNNSKALTTTNVGVSSNL